MIQNQNKVYYTNKNNSEKKTHNKLLFKLSKTEWICILSICKTCNLYLYNVKLLLNQCVNVNFKIFKMVSLY